MRKTKLNLKWFKQEPQQDGGLQEETDRVKVSTSVLMTLFSLQCRESNSSIRSSAIKCWPFSSIFQFSAWTEFNYFETKCKICFISFFKRRKDASFKTVLIVLSLAPSSTSSCLINSNHVFHLVYITFQWEQKDERTSHFPCWVLFFKWIFQCSEFTSAQCGIVKANGELTETSEGPHVTSGPRRTSGPSGCRLGMNNNA